MYGSELHDDSFFMWMQGHSLSRLVKVQCSAELMCILFNHRVLVLIKPCLLWPGWSLFICSSIEFEIAHRLNENVLFMRERYFSRML